MGTRSYTRVFEGDTEVICIYRQMDGYPEGMGLDLATFLSDMVMTNGIALGEKRRIANGAGCLAAQLVAHFKNGPGSIYIDKYDLDGWQDYEYEIYTQFDQPEIEMKCLTGLGKNKKVLFVGSPADFITWAKTYAAA